MRLPAFVLLAVLAGCEKQTEEEDTVGMDSACPLSQLIAEAEFIGETVLTQPVPAKDEFVLVVRSSIKGSLPLKSIPFRIGSVFIPYQAALRRHLSVPGTPVVLMHTGGTFVLYVDRFFVAGYGSPEAWGSGNPWLVSTTERWLTRGFRGSAPALADTIRGVLAGTLTAPPYDDSRPLLTRKSLMELPVWGEPVDPEYLPAPFR